MDTISVVILSGSDVFESYSVQGYITSIDDNTINKVLSSISNKYGIIFDNIERRFSFIRICALNKDVEVIIEPMNKLD